MTTPTDQTSTSLATLVKALRAHLQDYPLPEPATVSLEPPICRVSIQVATGRDDLVRLGELLLWAYTLDQVRAQWWHTPRADLHITIEGRCATGIRFRVYGGMPVDLCADLVQLASGAAEAVSVDELYTLLVLLREQQASIKEVAA